MKRIRRASMYGVEKAAPWIGRVVRFLLNALVEPPPVISNVDRPFGLCLEGVTRISAESVFVRGWIWDLHSDVDRLRLIAPSGERIPILERLHRLPRQSIEERYREHFGERAKGDHGFVCFVECPAPVGTGHQWTLEARLGTTREVLRVGAGEEAPNWRVARDSILADLPADSPPDLDLLKDCLLPALDWTLRARGGQEISVEEFSAGPVPDSPEISVIVALSRLDLVRNQLAEFADDPDLRASEILYVLDNEGIREAFRELAFNLSRLYGVAVRALFLSEAVGYAASVNTGARHARGERLVLLDEDVLPKEPGWLGKIDSHYRSSTEIGTVSPKLLGADGSVQHAGYTFSRDAEQDGLWSPLSPLMGLPRQHPGAGVSSSVTAVSGACMMIRRSLFERLGGFRDRHVAGEFEDLDLCLRCGEEGLQNRYLADVEMFYLSGLSHEWGGGHKRTRWSRLLNRWLLTRSWGGRLETLMGEQAGELGAVQSTHRISTVSLVIPTLNAGPEFRDNLALMLDQELDAELEVVVIDSGSRDGTVEYLRQQPVRLIEIKKTEFDHGLTRQLGVREATGEIVAFVTQDARPFDRHWLQTLVNCYSDPSVAGAYSRQIARPDANPFAREQLRNWLASQEQRRIQYVGSQAEFDAMTPIERLESVAFDNVSSSVRRQVALEVPFRSRPFGEDIDWGQRVTLRGYKIVYEPASKVVHSHNNSISQQYRRVRQDHRNLADLLDLRMVPTWSHVLRATREAGRHLSEVVRTDADLPPSSRVSWRLRAWPFAFAQALGQYHGAREAS